eukprot:6463744-Heterocapsa_arctica.AAC.1
MGISMQEWKEGEKAGCEEECHLDSIQEEPNTKRGDGGGRVWRSFTAKLEKTKNRRQLRHGQPEC